MPFLLVLIGAVLAIAAFRNTQGDLATALETDIPGFSKWALALVAVGGLGWVPGMQVISRWLVGLVLVVIVLRNYQGFLQGFQALGNPPAASQAAATPAAAIVAKPTATGVTAAEVSGTGNVNANRMTATVATPFGAFDPAAFLTAYEAGVGGFGGVA